MTSILKKFWKSEIFKTAFMIAILIGIVFGFWYGSQMILNTQYPALAVASGSMCITEFMRCDGWSHPFERTLHIGDLIIVQGVRAEEINCAYPNSDIIVFHKPLSPEELIVHRVVSKEVDANGKITFRTKGDGASPQWPVTPSRYQCDPWEVSEDLLVGKVVFRIPWIGHIALLMHNSSLGIFIIVVLIVLIVIIEFVIPAFASKEAENKRKEASLQSPIEPV